MKEIQEIIDSHLNNGLVSHEALQNAASVVMGAFTQGVLSSGGTVIVPTIDIADIAYSILAKDLNIQPIQVICDNTPNNIIEALNSIQAKTMTVPATNNEDLILRCTRLTMTLYRGAFLAKNL